MDIEACRARVKEMIHVVAQHRPRHGDIAVDVVEDDANGHYQVIFRGWEGDERVYLVLVHLRLQDAKVYVERDGTADGAATYLLAAGIPAEQIVMGIHPPYLRRLTPFSPG